MILIAGATGTIGSQLARELLDRGATIRAASRRPDALSELAERGADVVGLDLEELESLAPALEGVERFFLVGPGGADFGERLEPVMSAAADAGLSHVLRYSALGADPDAPFTLARQHGIGEQHVEQSGIAWTVFRPTFYQDNLVNSAGETIRTRGVFYGASGTGKTAYVSSADIVRAAATILEDPEPHAGEKYLLTGPEALSDDEVAELASEVLGREIRYVDVPPEKLALGMRERGTPDWIVDSMIALEAIKRDGYASAVSPAVLEITGREPEPYRSFLERNREKLV